MDQTKKEALTSSLAVFPGYLVVGIAFGLLAQQHQIGWGWALMMSVLVYAGSMQFVGIQLLAQAASPLQVILMTLAVNLRHLFYGFSFLREFGERGVRRLYLILSRTIFCSTLLSSFPILSIFSFSCLKPANYGFLVDNRNAQFSGLLIFTRSRGKIVVDQIPRLRAD